MRGPTIALKYAASYLLSQQPDLTVKLLHEQLAEIGINVSPFTGASMRPRVLARRETCACLRWNGIEDAHGDNDPREQQGQGRPKRKNLTAS